MYASAGKSPLRHARIERALDAYLNRVLPKIEIYPQFYAKKPLERYRHSLFLLYASFAAANRLPTLKKSGFYRAFSLFNAYLPRLSAISKEKNTRVINSLCNTENAEWANPALPSIKSRDGGLELFQKAVNTALDAVSEFDLAIKNKTALPFAVFGKNYLSGL